MRPVKFLNVELFTKILNSVGATLTCTKQHGQNVLRMLTMRKMNEMTRNDDDTINHFEFLNTFRKRSTYPISQNPYRHDHNWLNTASRHFPRNPFGRLHFAEWFSCTWRRIPLNNEIQRFVWTYLNTLSLRVNANDPVVWLQQGEVSILKLDHLRV